MSDYLSGFSVQRKYSCLFLIPRIKTNNARWAGQKGRCGVRRPNHGEREDFSLSAAQEDRLRKKGESSERRCVRDSLSGFKAAAKGKPYTRT